MDQRLMAGLGNLLVEEMLWVARIHPRSQVSSLGQKRRDALFDALRKTLRESIPTGRVPPRRGWLTAVRDEREARCPRCNTALPRKHRGGPADALVPALPAGAALAAPFAEVRAATHPSGRGGSPLRRFGAGLAEAMDEGMTHESQHEQGDCDAGDDKYSGQQTYIHQVSGYGHDMGRKILALVSEPVSGEALKQAVGRESAENAEVLVVAPAYNTRTRFWLSDVDEAIARADDAQAETVERMEGEGVEAVGDTGESDPLLAIADALQTFPADEIVLFTHAGSERNWTEEGLVEQARERFDADVQHQLIER
jgi:hypothetical protein